MPIIEINGLQIDVDEDGFIQEPDKWSEEIAVALATTEGVTI